jgi:small subunit ribosomal protein S13
MNELTKYQIDQIEQMVAQDHVVHWELKRGERADIERLISISHYRGIHHQDSHVPLLRVLVRLSPSSDSFCL